MTENSEATPLEPDPENPTLIDVGEGQDQPITEEYLETAEEARQEILENDE